MLYSNNRDYRCSLINPAYEVPLKLVKNQTDIKYIILKEFNQTIGHTIFLNVSRDIFYKLNLGYVIYNLLNSIKIYFIPFSQKRYHPS